MDIVYSENELICSGSLVVLYVACIFAYVINELVDFMLSRSVWFIILKTSLFRVYLTKTNRTMKNRC